MPKLPNVTIAHLAEQLGLDKSTVSRALRRHPMVSVATRNRVLRLAGELNYQPAPILSQVASRRMEASHSQDAPPFAYVFCPLPICDRHADPMNEPFFPGILARAQSLGYQVDFFNLVDYGCGRRLSEALVARGIQGVVLGPVQLTPELCELDWDSFSLVGRGMDLYPPPIHKVRVRGKAQLACRKAFEYGYRRIGMCAWIQVERVSRDAERIGGFIDFSQRWSGKVEPVPILLRNDRESFLSWFHRHRPDVVISPTRLMAEWLVEDGVRIPEDTGFICMNPGRRPGHLAACLGDPERIGAISFDLCRKLVAKNERGLPAHPQTIYAKAKWFPGLSLPLRPEHGEPLPKMAGHGVLPEMQMVSA